MRYESGKVQDIRLAYIGGGSRGWAWNFMTDLAMEPSMGGQVALYDIDRPAAEANAIIGNGLAMRAETVGHWHYAVADSLEEALTGADFVVISILPGTFDEMEVDVHLPERLGIYQSVGDTAGPGGIIRALRTLPMFIPMAETIRRVCPDAWVINYTNPMSLCVRMLYEVYPGIKAFGCCHEVFNTEEILACAVAEELGIEPPPREDIHVNVMGLNHFTWFTEASYEGYDIFPMYQRFTERHFEEGFEKPNTNWMNSSFDCAHRVKMDLFRRYGAIAAAGDRHLAEFMPGDAYLKDPETVRAWKFGLTPVSWRKEDLQRRLKKSAALVAGSEAVEMKPSGEEGIRIIKAILGLGRLVTNVNIPNRGQISNLPHGVVVETNAVFDRDSIKPVLAGEMPEGILKLTMPHVKTYELALQAVKTKDRGCVVEAFLGDPNVSARCHDEAAIRSLVEDMLRGTAKYLPDGWVK